ncbi:MAG: 30S ribosomal protein S6 [Candidatus Latescibacterota bacterium]
MKNYELVCIFDPQVGEGQFEQAVERYKTYITDNGGEIVNVDLWGLRRMAYTSQSLKNRRQGYYVLYQFTAEPTFVAPMEQSMKLDDELLRHLVIAVEDEFIRVPQLMPEDYLKEQLAPPRRERPGRPGDRSGRPGDRPDRGPRRDSDSDSDAPRREASEGEGAAEAGADSPASEEEE